MAVFGEGDRDEKPSCHPQGLDRLLGTSSQVKSVSMALIKERISGPFMKQSWDLIVVFLIKA